MGKKKYCEVFLELLCFIRFLSPVLYPTPTPSSLPVSPNVGLGIRNTREAHMPGAGPLKDSDIITGSPPPHRTITLKQDPSIITMDYRYKVLQRADAIKKEFSGKRNDNRGERKQVQQRKQGSGTKSASNNKHSPIPRQFNIKPHTKDLFTSIPITHVQLSIGNYKAQYKANQKHSLKRQSKYHNQIQI